MSKIVDPLRVEVITIAFTELPDIVEYNIGFVVSVEIVILDRSKVLPSRVEYTIPVPFIEDAVNVEKSIVLP